MRYRIIGAAIVAASFVSLLAPAAHAEGDRTYTLAEQERLSEITSVSTSDTITASSVNCRTRKRTRQASTLAGVAWSIYGRGSWCWRRGQVTSFSYGRDFYVNSALWNLWSWEGWEGLVKGGGVGQSYVYRRSKGHFRVCFIVSLIYCRHAYPWTAQTFRGDGTYTADDGG